MLRSPTNKCALADAHLASVWLLDCRTVEWPALGAMLEWLSPSELQRYRRFLRLQRQRQFLAGRILLRQALGELLALPGKLIELDEQAGRAPKLLTPGQTDLGYSLSHSGNWVACVVSAHVQLGLDIECLNVERDFAALAAQVFDVDECAQLTARADEYQKQDFYRMWSTKEAQFKLGLTAAQCYELPHPDLSIIVCSSQSLSAPPTLTVKLLLP